MKNRSAVYAACNNDYSRQAVEKSIYNLLDYLETPLHLLIKNGDRVLLKVNLGCSGLKTPEQRRTTHPMLAEILTRAIQSCGGHVLIGDDGSQPHNPEQVWKSTGMLEVARRTGAKMVCFRGAGIRHVRSSFFHPFHYAISNAVFDADLIVNLANARSHSIQVFSGSIKNMFGVVVGHNKSKLHSLFPNPKDFCLRVADIYKITNPTISFLDLTTVVEGDGVNPQIKPVGLLLAGTDPVALDTVALHAIGYQNLKVWSIIQGAHLGLGCSEIKKIKIHGLDWGKFDKKKLEMPYINHPKGQNIYDITTRFLNNTALRKRPKIVIKNCIKCDYCYDICPAKAIFLSSNNKYFIDINKCIDCYCCLKVCEHRAVTLDFFGISRFVRGSMALIGLSR